VTGTAAEAVRVLVADDDPLIRDVLRTILDLEGVAVVTAHDGEATLAELATDPVPHVLVLDVMMPGIDGLEVCRRVRSDPRTARIPVILLTARDRDEDRVAGLEAGADDYLTKPFSPLALIERIADIASARDGADPVRRR
jgi:DNA-binding response OmpR family regulator